MTVKKRESALSLKVVVASLKGGGGKSNITANLAVAFQKKGMYVVVIDSDRAVSTSEQWHDDREEYIDDHPDDGVTLVRVVKMTGRLGNTIDELATYYNVVLTDTGG